VRRNALWLRCAGRLTGWTRSILPMQSIGKTPVED